MDIVAINPKWIMVFVLGGGALAVIYGGLTLFIQTWKFVAAAERTAGKVVSYETQSHFADSPSAAYPIVEFRDIQGTQRCVKTSTAITPSPFKVGDSVTVRYNRDNPEHAEIESFAALWAMPVGVLAFGVMFLVIAIASF